MLTKDEWCEQHYANQSKHADLENFSFQDFTYPGDPTVWKSLETPEALKLAAYVVIIVGGLLGNVSVILTVALNPSMRSTIDLYVANLAVADAMICIICMVPHALSVMTTSGDIYVLGEFMCKFNPFTQMTCLTCSVLTLSAISCDLFVAILLPIHKHITENRTSLVSAVVWIVSLAVSAPFLVVKKHIAVQYKNFVELKCGESWPVRPYYDESAKGCASYDPLRTTYYVVVSITLFFLPILIMITAYSLIVCKLWIIKAPGVQHEGIINMRARAKKKVNKMVVLVMVVFIICWTPLQVMVLYSAFGHNATVDGALPEWFTKFKWFSYYIAYANSFMNPIIYGGFNPTFREGFFILLRCGYRGNRREIPRPSRMTITAVSSRNASRTQNGAHNRSPSQKSDTLEMKPLCHSPDSPEDLCVSIAPHKGDFT